MPLIGRKNVEDAIDRSIEAANNNLRGVYFSGLSDIIMQTPVDEGRARNNWFFSVSSPSNATTTSKSSGLGSMRQLSQIPKTVINKQIYLTNNLSYIGVLEYGGFPSPVKKGSYIKKSKSYEILSVNGFSKQSPSGWVRKTLIQMQNKIRLL